MSHYSGNYQNTGYSSNVGQVPQYQPNQNQNNAFQPQSYNAQKPQVVSYQSGYPYTGQNNQPGYNQSGGYNQPGSYQSGGYQQGYQGGYNSQSGSTPIVNQDPNARWSSQNYQPPSNPNVNNYSYSNNPQQPITVPQPNNFSQNYYGGNGGQQQEDRGQRSSWNSHSGWGSKYQDLVNGSSNFWKQKYEVKSRNSTVFKLDLNQKYSIHTSLDNQKVIDISKTSISHKTVIYTNKKKPNQQFRIASDNGLYKFYSIQQPGWVLKVQKQSCANKANIIAGPEQNSPSQQWQILPVSDKQTDGYFIKTFNGKCMDVQEQKTSDNTQIIQYDYNGGKNQIWFIRPS